MLWRGFRMQRRLGCSFCGRGLFYVGRTQLNPAKSAIVLNMDHPAPIF